MSTFYIEKYDFQNKSSLEEVLKQLHQESIDSKDALEQWLTKQSKVFDAIEEALTGHYIDFQCRNQDEEAKRTFEHDQQEILPLIKKYEALLDQKFYDSSFRDQIDQSYYGPFIKRKKNAIELFREENIALEIEEDRLSTNYFEHTGSIMVEWDGEERTLSQMQMVLKDSDRVKREKAWKAIAHKIEEKQSELKAIMNELIKIRQEKAINANLPNYRDYMFKKYERFDYTPEDCKKLADAVLKHVVPLKVEIEKEHKKELAVDTYRPWDTQAVPANETPLKPFEKTNELISKTADILDQLDSRFSELIQTMNSRGMLDLESRKGKSPGGFCAPLPVSDLSFIFMNASNTQSEAVTLIHEMGHCIHNDFKKDLTLSDYKETPMESSELASMTMELFSMNLWNVFYNDEEDLKRAKKEQLEGIVKFLPWGVVIDQFQHWMYENPQHTDDERESKFKELFTSYIASHADWSGLENYIENRWLMQLHIYEVPFYYIEYVIAQLGAVQMYKQYKENPEQALENYKHALSLGSSKGLSEVYEAAGIQFDFSESMLEELMEFIKEELKQLN